MEWNGKMLNIFDRSNELKTANSFKSYVSVHDVSQPIALEPTLLPGEVIISRSEKVLMFSNVAEKNKGLCGELFVTSFKLSFVTTEEKSDEECVHQQNLYLGDYDVCLTNIDSIYQVSSADKRRKLNTVVSISGKVKGLHIICKNLKVLNFSFELSSVDNGKNCAIALLHHAFPTRHTLLFAYDYKKPDLDTESNTVKFQKKSDWEQELERTWPEGRVKWRISCANQEFELSPSLPRWLIVPQSVLDWQLADASRHFRCSRPPTLSWASSSGAAIVRMADILPTITDRTKENIMLENIRKSHPKKTAPKPFDLSKDLPSVKDVQTCYTKLKELCTPESMRQFHEQDSHFYSFLDNTKWLYLVSLCLKKAVQVVKEINANTTVVLQEFDGRDTSAIVSCLSQMMLDAHSRSLAGFQSLIQKEWVVFGHPFCKRLGHVSSPDTEQSPMFLLFLDCVWQLQRQFPVEFEFSETYLTTLWDSCHLSILETFLFDCEKDRLSASRDQNNPFVLRSVWNWNIQFSEVDQELFKNPLYKIKDLLGANDNKRNSYHAAVKHNHSRTITPSYQIPNLEIWQQCYFRWLPCFGISGGGFPQVDLRHRHLVSQIESLMETHAEISKKLCENGVYKNTVNNSRPTIEAYPEILDCVDSFYPFTSNKNQNTFVMTNSSFISADFDTQSILNDTE